MIIQSLKWCGVSIPFLFNHSYVLTHFINHKGSIDAIHSMQLAPFFPPWSFIFQWKELRNWLNFELELHSMSLTPFFPPWLVSLSFQCDGFTLEIFLLYNTISYQEFYWSQRKLIGWVKMLEWITRKGMETAHQFSDSILSLFSSLNFKQIKVAVLSHLPWIWNRFYLSLKWSEIHLMQFDEAVQFICQFFFLVPIIAASNQW